MNILKDILEVLLVNFIVPTLVGCLVNYIANRRFYFLEKN